jgi:hypothetical protein
MFPPSHHVSPYFSILTMVQEIRDLVLHGDLDPSACCSYGKCIGDVNVEGG